ncbi:c-type cytochrome biogenesis protein CcsB [Nakamurella sp. A5-74]|uniref:C-type cytochrome biogenesis protein CcsB n=1 Tax=Nakamurella sp. A5-74 TaxID=3158264 RepID=A0AAU8DTK7_9ACTN
MAGFSDLAFQAAMAAYVVALICYGIEFAARRAMDPTQLEVASREHRLVKAGVGAPESLYADRHIDDRHIDERDIDERDIDDELDDDELDEGPRTQWGPLFGRAAVVLTVIGALVNATSVVTRGIAAGRLPLGNMYEFTSFICLAATTCWLIVLAKFKERALGFFVMIPVAILAFVAGTVLWIQAGPVQPSLNSYWKWIHVTTISASGSVLLVSGAASAMYLLRHRFDSKLLAARTDATATARVQASSLARLPSLAALDKIAYRTAIVAFPVYTFAVIAGALWAEVAWGRYWGWDPKETVAFVSWVFYAGYLHARATSGWRGARAAWINVVGFAAIIFNLFFVNMVITGLHSYAGVG